MIAIIGDVFVKADKIADYVPGVSSITNFVGLFQKHAIQPCMGKNSVAQSHYYTHLQGKSSLRSILLLIPILGNILIAIYDVCVGRDPKESCSADQQHSCNNKKQPKTSSEKDQEKLCSYVQLQSPHTQASLSSMPPTLSESQIEGVKQACKEWMSNFLKDFEPLKVRTYTFRQLYAKDVVTEPKETLAMRQVFESVWGENLIVWKGILPEGWKRVFRSNRSWGIVNPLYPDYIFKICTGTPGRGVQGAHFLRIPKGKEVQGIIHEMDLDELAVVEESLLALKPREEIENMSETDQSLYFVVKSKKMNLLGKEETISALASLPVEKQIKIATQVLQLICKSGLGDIGFHNLQVNKDTGKLVIVDTEPLLGSLVLEETDRFEEQYRLGRRFEPYSKNSIVVKNGLENMLASCEELPIFKAVAKAYVENFIV